MLSVRKVDEMEHTIEPPPFGDRPSDYVKFEVESHGVQRGLVRLSLLRF